MQQRGNEVGLVARADRRRPQRAIVVAYLEQRGVSADHLSMQGFGPDRPVADNTTDEGWARNRRIEFRVL